MYIRFRYRTLGGHTHVRVFSGRNSFSLGKAGDLTFRNEEFEAFKDYIEETEQSSLHPLDSVTNVEFLPEEEEDGSPPDNT